MIEIKHRDKFNITGRGIVYSGSLEDNPGLTHEDIDRIKDEEEVVIIDRQYWTIRGIERFALPTALLHTRPEFGLLVKAHFPKRPRREE